MLVCGGVQSGPYCNNWHSCCSDVVFGPCVEVLLDLPSHRQLVLVLCTTIILENAHNKASATLPVVSHRIVSDRSTLMYTKDDKCWTYINPGMVKNLYRCESQIHIDLQHPSDQSLKRNISSMNADHWQIQAFHTEQRISRWKDYFQRQTLAVSDTLSQYGAGKSSWPLKICSNRASWSSPLL